TVHRRIDSRFSELLLSLPQPRLRAADGILCSLERRLGHLILGFRPLQHTLRNRLPIIQLTLPVQVEFGTQQVRPPLRRIGARLQHVRFRLFYLCRVEVGTDANEQITTSDLVALTNPELDDLTRDVRTDLHLYLRLHLPRSRHGLRYCSQFYLCR